MPRKLILLLIILTCTFALTNAQEPTEDPTAEPEATAEATSEAPREGCPEIVDRALTLTREGCGGTGSNRICYGHVLLDAELRDGADQEQFNDPGETTDVVNIQNLSLSALDTAAGVWGVVKMQLQPNITLEAQEDDVTFLVFGDAALENATQLIPIITTTNLNIRSAPSTDSTIIESIGADESLVASGRSPDNAWLRLRLQDEDETRNGWLATSLIETEYNLEDLPVIDPNADEADDLFTYGPMQAFYFESNRDDAPCEEAPNSGLIIQTPEGEASVSVWIDEVIVELNATAFVQAQRDGNFTINVLDGAARVTANGETQIAVAGQAIDVELNEDLSPQGAPGEARDIDAEDVQSLPTSLLDEEIDVEEVLNAPEGAPTPGSWSFAWGVSELTCPDGTSVPFESTGGAASITVTDDGSAIFYAGSQYNRAQTSVYTRAFIDDNGNLHQDTLTVASQGSIQGQKVIEFSSIVCTLTVPFSLSLVGAS
jgi:uncharacterized protein YraI